MPRKWHIEYVGCWGYEDVWDVEFWRFGMFRMLDDGDEGCSECQNLVMWDIWDVGYWGCRMLGCGMSDVGC